ncbi:hypothetical protein SeMB42_g03281 [Synchytrium endobioticum]|uniref:Uncharacterized protein n=1 Tax=Synchytrium endobioticum TaxID=286115 RepID=A0A507DIS4_9FUNG|nr:hypothetical protein SeMB42_g03281 [Synchytrium endobioticum]TPX51107.1 hypothetical protein SeLEV6574_g00507 [Synchytrium endobioticum]
MGTFWDWLTKRRHIVEANFVDSKLLPIGVLLAMRIVFFLYCAGIFIWRNIVNWNNGRYYTYFTNISYLILTLYFGAVSLKGIIVLTKSHRKRKLINDHPADLTPRPADLQSPASGVGNYVLLVLFSVALQNALFLDFVAWIVLPRYASWMGAVTYSSVQVHGVNTIQMILEVFLSLMPVMPLFVIYPLVFTLLYMFFTWIYHAVSSIWVYPFVAWGANYDWLIYLGVVGLFFFSWFIWCLFGWIRDRIPDYRALTQATTTPHSRSNETQTQPTQRGGLNLSEITAQQ